MAMKKFGTPEDPKDGRILPEPGDDQKTAAQSGWSDQDQAELSAENAQADSDQ